MFYNWPIQDILIKSPMVKGTLEFEGSMAGPRTPKQNRKFNDGGYLKDPQIFVLF